MTSKRTLLRYIAAMPLSAILVARGETASAPPIVLDFHSSFLINLHHFLYNLAKHPAELNTMTWDASDMAVLRKAAAFYTDNYAKRDLLFDEPMPSIKLALSAAADAQQDASGLALPNELAAVLSKVAPLYARYAWARDNASNQRWVDEVKPLNARYGAEIQNRVAAYLQAPFPLTPIRVDVVVSTGTRQGAYTDTQTVMPSGRADYQGLASLEMIYHETSHISSTDKLEQAIAAHVADSDLWHVVQFYTVGIVTKQVLQHDGIAYEPYAYKGGLFKRYWSTLAPLAENDWQAYMDGKLTFQQAIDNMTNKLPRT